MLWWSLYFAAILITSKIQMSLSDEPLLGYASIQNRAVATGSKHSAPSKTAMKTG